MNPPAFPAQPDTASVAGASVIDDDAGIEDDVLVEDELLVEDVSIDGMCGVY